MGSTLNIRVYLGETDVNDGITETIDSTPEFFWYFNNGITALCDKIDKKPIGGTGHETGIFECTNLKIVNGAQTVGTIHSLLRKNPENLEKTRVWIRIISLENADEGLAKNITKTNNTQNRIEKRDFVALDPEQKRLHDEFNIESLVYLYKSGELRGEEEGLDLVEATVARACVQDDIQFTYQAKREISKLWDDIEKPPYKILFNSSTQCLKLWREVQVLRVVEKFVADKKRVLYGRDKLMVTHGNRFLLHLIFRELGDEIYTSDEIIREEHLLEKCEGLFSRLNRKVNDLYQESVLGSLFKNLTKCRHIKEEL